MLLQDTYRGLRVIDLATNIAGPFAAMVLGDMGANVVKIERPPQGDDTRALPPRWRDQSTVYLACNRNKRSVLLDSKTTNGRDAVLRLIDAADVVIESFPPGVAERLGLRYDDMRPRNPRVIVCSISAFGDGPLGSTMPGYDALVQAVSGLMSFTGHPGTQPVRIAPSVLDLTTGMWGVIGILAALKQRESDGNGAHVRPALIDSAFTLMCHQVLGYVATGEAPAKLGSGAPSAVPYRVFEAKDGAVMVATATDRQFQRLCEAVALPALLADPRFKTMDGRIQAREELEEVLGSRFRQEPVSVWLPRLAEAGISAGSVNDLRQALESPVSIERGLLVQPEQYDCPGGLPLLRLPIDADGSGVMRAPPRLGEHTAEVLREAGFDEAQIGQLSAHAPY